MIAIDSSVVVDLLQGADTPQRQALETLLSNGRAILPPATLTELLSDPAAKRDTEELLAQFIMLPVTEGYWQRTGALRAKVRAAGRKAALGDALIAQSCIDSDVPLLTRDADFKAYVKFGLKLA